MKKHKIQMQKNLARNLCRHSKLICIKQLLQFFQVDDEEEDIEDSVKPNDEEDSLHKKLIEETQQLRVQLDEYEGELSDLSSGVEKNIVS